MNDKLEKKLFEKYSELFKQHSLDMSQTAMCWGCQCGDGWYWLLERLCDWITWNITKNKHMYPKIQFTTVKEKFGRLRIYHSCEKCTEEQKGGLDNIEGAISIIEDMSAYVCEVCGQPGKLVCVNGWYLTVCDKCLKNYLEEKKALFGENPKIEEVK